jgi:ribosomal-protein-alanine N-acetyltransferase
MEKGLSNQAALLREQVSRLLMPAGIRVMQRDDLDAVYDIETRAYAFPWTRGIFRECFRVGYPAWVVLDGEKVVGYGILSVAADEAHILNLCIDPDHQRRGLGRLMLDALLIAAKRLGAERVFLEVRQSNQRAAAMYLASGFKPIGVRKRYYKNHDSREDAVVLSLEFSGGCNEPS